MNDLRTNPFLLSLRDWSTDMESRLLNLRVRIDNLRFPPDESWKERYDEMVKRPKGLSLEDLDL